MKKRIVLALPMVLVLVWISYLLLMYWDTLSWSNIFIIPFVIVFAVLFIFMQLTSKFIDFLDGFKVKPITYENLENLQKVRRFVGGIMITILLVMFVVDFLMK